MPRANKTKNGREINNGSERNEGQNLQLVGEVEVTEARLLKKGTEYQGNDELQRYEGQKWK